MNKRFAKLAALLLALLLFAAPALTLAEGEGGGESPTAGETQPNPDEQNNNPDDDDDTANPGGSENQPDPGQNPAPVNETINVTIKVNDLTIEYDGREHPTAAELQSEKMYSVEGLPSGYQITVTLQADPKVLRPGESATVRVNTCEIRDGSGKLVTATVDTTDTGTVKIIPRNVTITPTTVRTTYTGAEQTARGLNPDFTVSNKITDRHVFSVSADDITGSGTDAGKYKTKIEKVSITLDTSSGGDRSSFYNVTFAENPEGLVIEPAAITVDIAGQDKTEVYDGTEKTLADFKATIPGTLYQKTDIEVLSGSATGTKVGDYETDFTPSSFRNNNSNFNVTFNVTGQGTLTITPKAITVKVTGNKKTTDVYDKTEKKVEGYTVAAKTAGYTYTADDCTFSGTAVAKGTYGGTYPMGLTAAQFANTNNNYTVTFEVEDGYLTIKPREITLTSGTSRKAYDGKKLVNTNVTVGGDGLAKGDTIGFDKSKDTIHVDDFDYKTKVGKVQNGFQYEFLNEDVENSYKVTRVYYGTLTVTKSGSSTKTGVEDHWPMLLGGSALLMAASAAIVVELRKRSRRSNG